MRFQILLEDILEPNTRWNLDCSVIFQGGSYELNMNCSILLQQRVKERQWLKMTITTLTLTSVEEKRHNPGLTAITITHIDLRFN